MRKIFISTLLAASTALGIGLPAMSASAYTNPHPNNHCFLWANHVLHPVYPHCYTNLHP